MKKKILYTLLLILAFLLFIVPIKADSGWDFDYDSGSDWNSGSSWDSGSSWSNDYGSGGYYSGSLGNADFVIVMVIVVTFVIIVIIGGRNGKGKNGGNSISNNNYHDIDVSKIISIDPNLNVEEFKQRVYELYCELQEAWMNFDTDKIRKLTTDELYNMYSSQLKTLKLKKQKNMMTNFALQDIKIIDVKLENDVITTSVYMKVTCYDYVISEANNQVVRGTKDHKSMIEYEMSFVKSASNDKNIETCPNCGAPVDITSSATCPYCDSVLVKNASNYVISKKKCVGQRIL